VAVEAEAYRRHYFIGFAEPEFIAVPFEEKRADFSFKIYFQFVFYFFISFAFGESGDNAVSAAPDFVTASGGHGQLQAEDIIHFKPMNAALYKRRGRKSHLYAPDLFDIGFIARRRLYIADIAEPYFFARGTKRRFQFANESGPLISVMLRPRFERRGRNRAVQKQQRACEHGQDRGPRNRTPTGAKP
jgi:hypothetical protein